MTKYTEALKRPLADFQRHLSYDPETGEFTWLIPSGYRAKLGATAGGAFSQGYRRIGIFNALVPAHRLAWFFVHGEWPVNDIDHINGKRDDNRIANLRDVPRRMNVENKRAALPNNKTGYLGVRFHPHSGLYHASIWTHGKTVSLRYHKTPEEAHAAYLEAKRRLHAGCTI